MAMITGRSNATDEAVSFPTPPQPATLPVKWQSSIVSFTKTSEQEKVSPLLKAEVDSPVDILAKVANVKNKVKSLLARVDANHPNITAAPKE